MEARLSKLSNAVLEHNSKKDLLGANNQVSYGEYRAISSILKNFKS